jgi:BirA family biotin operon repressor/biotin-[acetyl-CoA-carboxylase] ligase
VTLDARLLQALRATDVHSPAGMLADEIGATVAQVELALAGLGEAGFNLENRPGFGWRLLGSPDRLITDDLRARLGPCGLAREILVFEETGSTNDVAARLGREGHAGGVVVFAERQTAGRGRFGRQWDSQIGAGLWFSLLLRPAWPPSQWVRLTTWAGVGVARAVEQVLGRATKIKWPNDVLIDDRKIAGILAECSTDCSGRLFAVVGIGLNVNQREFPAEIASRAASLRQLAGRDIDRASLAAAVLRELDARLSEVEPAFERIVREAARRSSILGTQVWLQAAGQWIEGTAEDIDGDGNLLLRMADGTLRPMSSGEVTSQPPPPVPDRG